MNLNRQQHLNFPIVIQAEKLSNAQNCLNSQKRIRNNSVYCNHQDRGWISVKNCEGCPHYKLDPTVTQAAPEEGMNSVEEVEEW
jgi:hypothetical protein